MDIGETLYVTSEEEWRGWLADNYCAQNEVWLVFYKKDSGKRSLAYADAVAEAICYGWIDSQIKSIDEETFARRFTPRRPGSTWSPSNMARALRMLRAGKMTQAGIALLPDEVLEAADEMD